MGRYPLTLADAKFAANDKARALERCPSRGAYNCRVMRSLDIIIDDYGEAWQAPFHGLRVAVGCERVLMSLFATQ